MLLALLLAAAPTAADAEGLASRKQWDDLYLAWAKVKPDGFSDEDKKRIAGALARGCVSLSKGDAVMAQSLGEKAVAFAEDADAMLCTAKAALKTEQRSEAEALLRTGRKRFAADDRFTLELGRLLVLENDGDGALAELQAIGPGSKLQREAAPLLKKARQLATQDHKARADLTALERKVASGEPTGGSPPRAAGVTLGSGSSSYESGTDEEGRRTRGNAYFRFRYFNGQRDFGQRADYEGRVQAALEEAREASNRLLGKARESPTDVILYSKAEFQMHHGAQAARAIAGFYSENAIRMNDSAEMTPHNQTVLVHEYVHAVLDEVTGFKAQRVPVWMNEGFATWVEWRYEGGDGPPPPVAAELKGVALKGGLPSLRAMANQSLVSMGDPGLAYHLAGAAVHELLRTGGSENLVGLFADVGGSGDLERVFAQRYGRSLAEFEENLSAELKGR